MKKVFKIICGVVLVVSLGCATIPINPPTGCEDSKIYAIKPTFDIVMSVAVTAVHVLASTNPVQYKLAHESAQAAAALFLKEPISLSGLTDNLILNIMSPLLGLIPVDQVLSECDRKELSKWFLMV